MIWKYDGSNWIWISGSDTPNSKGNYGTRWEANEANVPGSRQEAVSWIDSDNNLYLLVVKDTLQKITVIIHSLLL